MHKKNPVQRVRSLRSQRTGFTISVVKGERTPLGVMPSTYGITGPRGVPYGLELTKGVPRKKLEMARLAQSILDKRGGPQPTTRRPKEISIGFKSIDISKSGISAQIHPEKWQRVRRYQAGLPFGKGEHAILRRSGKLPATMPNIVGMGGFLVVGRGKAKYLLVPLRSRKMGIRGGVYHLIGGVAKFKKSPRMNAEAAREISEETGIPRRLLLVGRRPLSKDSRSARVAEMFDHDPTVPSAGFWFLPKINKSAENVFGKYFAEAGKINGFRHVSPKRAEDELEHKAFAAVPFSKGGLARFLRLENIAPGTRIFLTQLVNKMK